MATLHFFSGKMAAGKSTLARQLAAQHEAVLLVEDQLLGQLYPEEIKDIPGYLKYAGRLKQAITTHIQDLLRQGLSVVLDFPANTAEQRRWFRELIESTAVDHVLHFVDAPDALCKQQLHQRSRDLPEGAPFTSEAEFDAITTYFQPPTDQEGFNIQHHQR